MMFSYIFWNQEYSEHDLQSYFECMYYVLFNKVDSHLIGLGLELIVLVTILPFI